MSGKQPARYGTNSQGNDYSAYRDGGYSYNNRGTAESGGDKSTYYNTGNGHAFYQNQTKGYTFHENQNQGFRDYKSKK